MIRKLRRSFIKLLYVTLRALGISLAMTIASIAVVVGINLVSVFIAEYILFFIPI